MVHLLRVERVLKDILYDIESYVCTNFVGCLELFFIFAHKMYIAIMGRVKVPPCFPIDCEYLKQDAHNAQKEHEG